MEELAKRKDLIITSLDKGGTIVIMDTKNYNYIKEANQQLSDKANYKQLTKGTILQHNRIINQITERFKNENLLPKKLQMAYK